MGSIADAFASFLRDYVVEGVPASGPNRPRKSEGRAIGVMLEAAISNAALGSLLDVVKTTKANLDADLAHPASSVAMVYADATDANNDLYVKSGASGTGSWINTGLINAIIEGLAQPYVDDALAAAELVAEQRISLGERTRELNISQSASNGAVLLNGNGLSVPNGSSGLNSVIQPRWQFDGESEEGRTYDFKFGFDQSATFTRDVFVQMRVTVGGVETVRSPVSIDNDGSGTRRVVTIRYLVEGDESQIDPVFLLNTAGNTSSVETIALTDFRPIIVYSGTDVGTAGDVTIDELFLTKRRDVSDPVFLLSEGNRMPELSEGVAPDGGAVALGTAGLRFPSGVTGKDSTIAPGWDFNGAAHVGQVLRITLAFDQSATFTRKFLVGLKVRVAGVDIDREAKVSPPRIVGNRRIISYDYTIVGDETLQKPFIQVSSTTPTATEESITLTDFVPKFLTAKNEALSAADEALARRLGSSPAFELAFAYGRVATATHAQTRTVQPSGGDFTSLTAAMAGVTDATVGNRYRFLLPAGTQSTAEVFDIGFADIVGRGRGITIIDGRLPNDATESDIQTKSVLYLRNSTRVEGVTILAGPNRYGVHIETAGVGEDEVQEFINTEILHFGNDSSDFPSAWGGQFPLGVGISSGGVIIGRNCRFWGKNAGAFDYHTNADFTKPSLVDFEGCSFETDDLDGHAFGIAPVGSFQADQLRLVGCSTNADIVYGHHDWLHATLDKLPANTAEIAVFGHGNTPAVFDNRIIGKALCIESAATGASSSVTVSGTAVKSLFGDGTNNLFFPFGGSPGFKGRVEGWGRINDDISATNAVAKLGARLGDCTSVNKTLSVTVDGGAPIVITFNQNYTAQSNATILAAINLALDGDAVASEVQPGSRYRPHFTDEEFAPINSSGSGIPMGSVCAFDGDRRKVRLMTSADPAALFAGVAWEDIAEGTSGRVKNGGHLPLSDIRNSVVGALTFNATMSVGATPGVVEAGGSQGLLRAIRADAVEVRLT